MFRLDELHPHKTMGLQGLTWVTVIGWLNGIIYLDKPWGCPSLRSWITLSLSLILINLALFAFLCVDAFCNYRDELLEPLTYVGSTVLSTVRRIGTGEIMVSNVLANLIFKIQAKKLAKLWAFLYQQNKEDAKKIKFFVANCLIFLLTSLGSMINLALLTMNGIQVGTNYTKSWVGTEIGYIPFTIGITWFFIGPLVGSASFGFAALLSTLLHLQNVYERYCRKIRDMMRLAKMEGNRILITEEIKNKLFDEFEEIQNMFGLFDDVLAPMLLIIIAGSSIRLVSAAAHLVLRGVENGVDILFWQDVCHMAIVFCQLSLLEFGTRMLNAVK